MTGPRAEASRTGSGAPAPVAPPADPLDLLAAAGVRADPGEIRLVTVAAPVAPPERLLRLDPSEPGVFWDSASGPTAVGWGAAAVVRSEGPDRFEGARHEAGSLWARVRTSAVGDAQPLPPRLFGGFSFLAAPQEAPWAAFGEATFVLPRLLYVLEDRGARLAVAVTAEDAGSEGGDRLRRLVSSALEVLEAEGGDRGTGAVARPAGPDDPAAWHAAMASIRERIDAGRAEKIVAARVREVDLGAPLDPAAVLRRLRAGTVAEARFAFRFQGATFLGATPERLVTLRGRDVRSEALAGSMDADREDRAAELLASVKDAEEHAYVVRAIARALEPLCERLEYPPEPRIQRLRHVLHLHTPFAGRLAGPAHILELVERLHPTPAVGGTPTPEALAWIAEREPVRRGWYAAPVGWFDAAGDGEFVVALRSALVAGERARLYAGAGIVRDSDPAAELAETEVKLRTMGEALGWKP